jgi:hypothetical protein
MTGHLSDSEIEQYRVRASRPDDLLAANEHLAQCPECYARFNPNPDVGRLYRSMLSALAVDETPLSEHLIYDELAGVLDGLLCSDAADRCMLHIEDCDECREDVEWLRVFKDDLTRSRNAAKRAKVGEERAINRADTDEKGPHGLAEDVQRQYGQAGAYKLAVLAASILLIAGVALRLFTSGLRRENASLRGEVGQLRSDNETLRESDSELESLRNQVAEVKAQHGEDDGSGRGPGPAALVVLKDGNGSVQLYKDGSVKGIESAPANVQELVSKALASERIQVRPIHTTSIGKQGTLMGEQGNGNGFNVLQPVGTSVESARPTFRWTELPGAPGYTVLARDLASGPELSSGSLSGTTWTPAADLVRGHTYAWMVEANKAGKVLRAPSPNRPFAQFRVIGSAELEEVRTARSSWGNSHLVMAVVYGKAGLREEAERELKLLKEANSGSRVARALYQSIRFHGNRP